MLPAMRARARKPRSVLVWQGPSKLDPSVTIGAFLTFTSKNRKTGDIPGLSILRLDTFPTQAVRKGTDGAICGNCPHRGVPVLSRTGRVKRYSHRTCYVTIKNGPDAIYRSYRRGNVPMWTIDQAGIRIAGQTLRFGVYGDPAAVPVDVLQGLAKYARRTVGYTHQWRTAGLQGLCMASVETLQERAMARAMGYRTFRVSTDTTRASGEILCPAAPEAGAKTQCARCGLCSGKAGQPDARADITLPVHGSSGKAHFRTLLARLVPVAA